MKKAYSSGAPSNKRIAFISAQWHADIVNQARDAFVQEMSAQGIPPENIVLANVPGAFEIPLHAKRLALSGQFDAIVGSAFVVDGGIYRHDFVASTVVRALMEVQLDTEVPVFSVVLTPHHYHEHAEHHDYFKRHFVVKGTEAAQACINTLNSFESLGL